jgi:hypothetical protein
VPETEATASPDRVNINQRSVSPPSPWELRGAAAARLPGTAKRGGDVAGVVSGGPVVVAGVGPTTGAMVVVAAFGNVAGGGGLVDGAVAGEVAREAAGTVVTATVVVVVVVAGGWVVAGGAPGLASKSSVTHSVLGGLRAIPMPERL